MVWYVTVTMTRQRFSTKSRYLVRVNDVACSDFRQEVWFLFEFLFQSASLV